MSKVARLHNEQLGLDLLFGVSYFINHQNISISRNARIPAVSQIKNSSKQN